MLAMSEDDAGEPEKRNVPTNHTATLQWKPFTTTPSFAAFLRRPLTIIFVICLIAFLFHPKLLNIRLYFGSHDTPVPMNFVSNFYLWTRYNSKEPEKLVVGAADQLTISNFRARKTYLIIHGFTRNGLEQWILKLKDALLWRENCNVISVDWEAGSITAGYYVIQARVPEVGEDVAKLLMFLLTHSHLHSNDVHLIGHSLGAHAAGFAGKYLNGTAGRITGLDPAGLSYNGASSDSRLDKSDAAFVDVIHTHGCYTLINQWTDCFGTYDNMGDADFWPNGGEHQPACEEDGDGSAAVREHSNCDHGLAYVYFTESVYYYASSTRFLARKCHSWNLLNNGSCPCSDVSQYMGFNANPQLDGVYYLNTSKTKPYGILDATCSPAHYSLFKMFGFTLCLLLVLSGFFYSSLTLASSWAQKDFLTILTAIIMKNGHNLILKFSNLKTKTK